MMACSSSSDVTSMVRPLLTSTTTTPDPVLPKDPEQLIICTQGNEPWYVGAPDGGLDGMGDLTDYLSLLPNEFVSKIKANNIPKKPIAQRASAKFISKGNVSIFEDLAAYSKDDFWADIFTRITRGVYRKGFKFNPSSGGGAYAGTLVYKSKTGKAKEAVCEVPNDLEKAYNMVTSFMQVVGGIVSVQDKCRMLTSLSDGREDDEEVPATTANDNEDDGRNIVPSSTAVEGESEALEVETVNSLAVALKRKTLVKSSTTRVAVLDYYVKKIRNALGLTRLEERNLRAISSLLTTSSSSAADLNDLSDVFENINIAWDPTARKFFVIPKFISHSIFDLVDGTILVLNSEKVSATTSDRLELFDNFDTKKLSSIKITIKKSANSDIAINNIFIVSAVELIETYLFFRKYILPLSSTITDGDGGEGGGAFSVSREFTSSTSQREDERSLLKYIMMPAVIATVCTFMEALVYSPDEKKVTARSVGSPLECSKRIIGAIPKVTDVFIAAYPVFGETPFDLIKTDLIFRYNISSIKTDTTTMDSMFTPEVYSECISEIMSHDTIRKFLEDENLPGVFSDLIVSCATNTVTKILKTVIKTNVTATADGSSPSALKSDFSFHKESGFVVKEITKKPTSARTTSANNLARQTKARGGIGSKRWNKITTK